MLNTRNVACVVLYEMRCRWWWWYGGGGRIDDMYSNNFDFKEDNLLYDNQRAIFYSFQQNNIEQPNIFGMVLFGN